MAHKHSVYDSDAHFSINQITKVIKNESSRKTTLVQGDHNSERFSFEIPRYIEGHDMLLCDLIEVHYDNKESNTENISSDYYEVKDKQISPEDENVLVFSWLIIDTATKYAGTLEFSILFKCMEEGVCTYKWGTNINSDITVAKGKDNSGVVVERQPNVVDQWRDEIFGSAENAVANINLKEQEAIKSVQEVSEDVINAATLAEQNAKNVLASAIKGSAKGETVKVDDVSPVEHEMAVWVHGKNLFDVSKMHPTGNAAKINITEVGTNYVIVTSESGYNSNGFCISGLTLSQCCPQLREGDIVTLTAESNSNMKCFYLDTVEITDSSKKFWHFGSERVITREMLNAIVCLYGFNTMVENEIGACTISNIQIKEGIAPTEYTPYIEPTTVTVTVGDKTYIPETDGTVKGIMSTALADGISTDTEGVTIDCEYIVDTKTYIDKKFEELKTLLK